MSDLYELLNKLKVLFEQQHELQKEIEKLPKEQQELFSKYKLIEETLSTIIRQIETEHKQTSDS
jgi:predicted transcriptional regulator